MAIQLANIPYVEGLDVDQISTLFNAGDMMMVLPSIKSPAYWEAVRISNKYQILDNGLYEHGQVDFPKLIRMAIEFSIDEIVLPDVFKNSKETRKMFYQIQAYLNGNFKYGYVVHGRNIKEILSDIQFIESNQFINVIYLPKWYDTITMDRDHIIRQINHFYPNHKPIHYLGYTKPIYEPGFRSIDTVYPTEAASNKKSIENKVVRSVQATNFDYAKINPVNLDLAIANAATLKERINIWTNSK